MRADSLLEVSQRAQFDIQIAAQWLNLRLQLIGLAMLAGVSILALLQHHFDAIDAGENSYMGLPFTCTHTSVHLYSYMYAQVFI